MFRLAFPVELSVLRAVLCNRRVWLMRSELYMVPHTLRTRGMVFAFLFGPPRLVSRDEAAEVYKAVCDGIRTENFTLKFEIHEGKPAKHFNLVMSRLEGSEGVFGIQVNSDPKGQLPLRLLLNCEWPSTHDGVYERFDIASACVFRALGTPFTRVFAEARIRADLFAPQKDAVRHFTDSLLRFGPRRQEALGSGSLRELATKFSVAATPLQSEDPLMGAARDISIETLKQDPTKVYLEIVSKWPQVVDEGGGQYVIEPSRIRHFEENPSQFLKETYAFVERVSEAFCLANSE